jgi:DNA-binding SARP family transcriptional activator
MNNQSVTPVRFSMLGRFIIQCGEHSLTEDQIPLRKGRDLLKLLALAPKHRLHREEILNLLWPEKPPKQAAHNLSQTLYTLRPRLTALSACIDIKIDKECLILMPKEEIFTDVEEFEKEAQSLLNQSGQVSFQTINDCQQVTMAYTGDLLPEDGPSDLFHQRREQLRQMYIDLLLLCAHANLEMNFIDASIISLKQVLALDPSYEEAHFQLMRAYALNNQRQSALRQYQLLVETLRSELDAEPSQESKRLKDQILSGDTISTYSRIARKVGKCPYRGFLAFQEEDAPFFFGRKAYIDSLETTTCAHSTFGVIVGSSGSGKSSVLFAGLLPRLRKTRDIKLASFHPGNQPFYAMAESLLPLMKNNLSNISILNEAVNIAKQLETQQLHLSQIINQIETSSPKPKQLLLIIDQFEELYTLCSDDSLQKNFVDELITCVEYARDRNTAGLIIMITLRSDFVWEILTHQTFTKSLQKIFLLIESMTRKELHMVIEKPAVLQGAAFEPGLVERILDDVGERPGTLSLLEFTLSQLWKQQIDGWLTHSNYEALGRVEGVITNYANQVYDDLGDEERECARQALLQMVRPGVIAADTCRIATREEVGDECWKIIRQLANRRLVVTGRDTEGRETAELAHDVLIQKWERFKEWINDDRAFRIWQEQLRMHIRWWEESGRDEGALLRGVPLVIAQAWLRQRGEQICPKESSYINASEALQERNQKGRK